MTAAFHETGLILGIFEDSVYTKEKIKLKPGDLLFLYSDGITEAMNPDSKMYGADWLRNLVRNNHQKNASEIGQLVLDHIESFTESASQSDDITMMVIKRL